jgi:hypothetical protein
MSMSDIKRVKAAPLLALHHTDAKTADEFQSAYHELMWSANVAADQYLEAVRKNAKIEHHEAARRMMECQRDIIRLYNAIDRFQSKYASEA